MNRITLLDRSSSAFFTLGVITSFIGYLPNPILAAAGKLLSLLCYFLAYLTWYFVSNLYPAHPDLEKMIFNLNQYKSQNRLSAFIGLLGVLVAAIAFVFPVLLIPASWLYALSTACWVFSQIHKQFNPIPGDSEFSKERQKIYIAYAVCVLSIGILTAIATTLMVACPPLASTVIIVSLIIGAYLLAATIFLQIEYFRPEQIKNKQSYEIMLSGDLAPDQSCDKHPVIQNEAAILNPDRCNEAPRDLGIDSFSGDPSLSVRDDVIPDCSTSSLGHITLPITISGL